MINFPYRIEQEKRKTFAAHVYPDGKVIIKAPVEAVSAEIKGFVKRKTSWIIKQINYFSQFNKRKESDLSSGTEFFYLGKQYQFVLEISRLREYVEIKKSKITLYTPFPHNYDRVKRIFRFWITQQTEKEMMCSLERCLKKFPDMTMPNLKIRNLQKRWGSYIKRSHTIVLNDALIYAPKKCIDYVVCHELCHYYHKDHSAAFYSLLGSKIPNWVKIKDELEQSIYLK
ncbi:MAG: M48 family metallopeptidase [Alphaproteobacteria bacterium]|nr:M48 family metallopeptidase [Alphaproteobacteria bacterium]MCL2505693.1 M48 family metallopeptidase [Alphaproteobacteria bacterium]